jgi:hypothetical protein
MHHFHRKHLIYSTYCMCRGWHRRRCRLITPRHHRRNWHPSLIQWHQRCPQNLLSQLIRPPPYHRRHHPTIITITSTRLLLPPSLYRFDNLCKIRLSRPRTPYDILNVLVTFSLGNLALECFLVRSFRRLVCSSELQRAEFSVRPVVVQISSLLIITCVN